MSNTKRILVLVSIKKNGNKDFECLLVEDKIKIENYYNSVNVYSILLSVAKLKKLITSPEVLFVRYIHDLANSPENIVGAFERLLIRNDKSVRVVNLSLGPPTEEPQNLTEFDPVRLAIKNAGEKGLLVVVAAGNNGPNPNTLNPWSIGPNVISVGATDENKVLVEKSSRGDPENSEFVPTVVSNGNDPLGIPPGYDYIPVSTSFAAPMVSFIACLFIRFVLILKSCMKNRYPKDVEVRVAFMDTGLNPKELSKMAGPVHFMISNYVNVTKIHRILSKLTTELKLKNVKFNINTSPKTIKKMIVRTAKPLVENNRPFESGAGFVDFNLAGDYLKSFGSKELVEVFSDTNLIPEVDGMITKFDKQYGHFLTKSDIEYLLDLTKTKAHPVFQVNIKVISGY